MVILGKVQVDAAVSKTVGESSAAPISNEVPVAEGITEVIPEKIQKIKVVVDLSPVKKKKSRPKKRVSDSVVTKVELQTERGLGLLKLYDGDSEISPTIVKPVEQVKV